MEGQITLAKLLSPCKGCFHEYHGECACLKSEHWGNRIPFEPCSYWDPCTGGGIPLEELKGRE